MREAAALTACALAHSHQSSMLTDSHEVGMYMKAWAKIKPPAPLDSYACPGLTLAQNLW